MNGLTHGLTSVEMIAGCALAGEDPDEYQELLKALQKEYQPEGFEENLCVDDMAACLWRKKRAMRCETASIGVERQQAKQALTLKFKGSWQAPVLDDTDLLTASSLYVAKNIRAVNEALEEVSAEGSLKDETVGRLMRLNGPAVAGFAFQTAVLNTLLKVATGADDQTTTVSDDPELYRIARKVIEHVALENAARNEVASIVDPMKQAREAGTATPAEQSLLKSVAFSFEYAVGFSIKDLVGQINAAYSSADVRQVVPSPEVCRSDLIDWLTSQQGALQHMRAILRAREHAELQSRLDSTALPNAAILQKIDRYETKNHRRLRETIDRLKKLQAARRGEEA